MSEENVQDPGPTIGADGMPNNGPRVTSREINALLDRVTCIGSSIQGTTTTIVHAFLDEKYYLGSEYSACVSPENFDEQIGIQIAREKLLPLVRNKLWEFEGYRLYRAIQDGDLTVPAPDGDDSGGDSTPAEE